MFKILVTNGDSNTAGDELPGHTWDPQLQRSMHAWPARLAEYLQIPQLANVAEGGYSPNALVRSTIEAVHYLLKRADMKAEEILVGVMWGIVQRTEFPDDKNLWTKIYPSAAHEPMAKLWYKHFHTDFFASFLFYQNILLLQSFLERSGVRYFMCHAANMLVGPDDDVFESNFPQIAYLKELIDWSKFHFVPHPQKQHLGFLGYSKERKFPQYPGGHFNEIAHETYVKEELGPWLRGQLSTCQTTFAASSR